MKKINFLGFFSPEIFWYVQQLIACQCRPLKRLFDVDSAYKMQFDISAFGTISDKISEKKIDKSFISY